MMEVVSGDNWTTGAISRAKLQSNHHHLHTNPVFFRPDALPVAQPTVSKHWRESSNITSTMAMLHQFPHAFCITVMFCHPTAIPQNLSMTAVNNLFTAVLLNSQSLCYSLVLTNKRPELHSKMHVTVQEFNSITWCWTLGYAVSQGHSWKW